MSIEVVVSSVLVVVLILFIEIVAISILVALMILLVVISRKIYDFILLNKKESITHKQLRPPIPPYPVGHNMIHCYSNKK